MPAKLSWRFASSVIRWSASVDELRPDVAVRFRNHFEIEERWLMTPIDLTDLL